MSELQDAIDTLTDGDELREMTRHNAADFVRAIAIIVEAARLVADPNIEAAAKALHAVTGSNVPFLITETAEDIVAAALTPLGDTG